MRGQNASGRVTWVLSRFIAGSTAAVGPAARADQPPSPLSELGTPRLLAAAGVTGVPALSGSPGLGGRLAPGGEPEPFLPAPRGLVSGVGLRCGQSGGSYAASWVTGVTRVPHRPDLLVTFNDFCVIPGNLIPEGFGLAEYDPATGTLVQVATVFTRADFGGTAAEMSTWELGSPVFSGRYLCAIIAHPEYSTRTQLVLSYFDPATAPHGHVMMAGFRW